MFQIQKSKILPKQIHTLIRATFSFVMILASIFATITSVIKIPVKAATGNYINQSYLTDYPWDSVSSSAQPWRSYQETMPAHRFVNGIGVNDGTRNNPGNNAVYAKLLADSGIKNVRYNLEWGDLDYNTEEFPGYINVKLQNTMSNYKQNGIRPLILINVNEYTAVPNKSDTFTVSSSNQGAKSITFNNVSGISVGYSGLGAVFDFNPVVSISGNTVTFSNPIGSPSSGSQISLTKLKYRPFSKPGYVSYQETINGFNKYVDYVATKMAEYMGTTTNTNNKGFDLEIYNELSFGATFLDLNNYYETPEYSGGSGADYYIAQEFSNHIEGSPLYKGVGISNGFESQRPWATGSSTPKNFTSLSKHLYADDHNFGGLNTWQPEEWGQMYRTESAMRDLANFETWVPGGNHSRYTRKDANNQPVEVPIRMTEIGINGKSPNAVYNTETDELNMKARVMSRLYPFWIQKGTISVDTYVAGYDGSTPNDANGLTGEPFNILSQYQYNWIKNNPTSPYPTSDTRFNSVKTLNVIGNMAREMKIGMDPNLTLKTTRPISLQSWSGSSPQSLGTNLTTDDVFAFLPFQSNAKKFVIPFYMMTPDMGKKQADQNFSLDILGINSIGASAKVFDPFTNVSTTTTFTGSNNNIALTVPTADYAKFLIIEENVVTVVPPADFTSNQVGSPTINPSPTIDGNMDNTYTSNTLKTLTNFTPANSDTADLSANFRSTWDASNLYLHFDVKDQTLLAQTTLPAYQRDGVEILLDSNNSKSAAYDAANDCKITFPADTTNTQIPETYGGTNCNLTGISYKIIAKTGGYQMEIKIPFTSLGTNPATHSVNDLLGFDVQISDTDVLSTPRETILTLKNPNVATIWNTPSTWGAMRLDPADIVSPEILLNLKVNLQGAYVTSTSTMKNNLQLANLVPKNGLPSLPTDTVDWITVDLKQGGSVIDSKQALLNQAGNISISTDTPLNLTIGNNPLIDFTTNANVYGGNQALLKTGVYGLKHGNSNSDTKISSLDRTQLRSVNDSSNVYSNNDLNMDGNVTTTDRTIVRLARDATEVLK
jgi:hypothetical protein